MIITTIMAELSFYLLTFEADKEIIKNIYYARKF